MNYCSATTAPQLRFVRVRGTVAFRLQFIGPEDFVKVAVGCGLFVIVIVLVVCALFTPSATLSSRSAVVPPVPIASAAGDGPAGRRAQQAADGAVDLYGNEVTDAIATYSLDPGGSLYEVHSPQTELPKLRSPKS